METEHATGATEAVHYEEQDGVAWVTLDRPHVHNAFDSVMANELQAIWRRLRRHDDVRVVVLTGAGDRAFCTGVDRHEALAEELTEARQELVGFGSTPFMFNDPGDKLGPKSNDLWKPVIAAVNGMACGGAFYLLGEVDFVIAAEHATFFDPHVTFGMTTSFEPIHMLSKMPLQEVLRMSLLGNHERLSAARAYQIGLVSEVVPSDDLRAAAAWAAEAIASAPPLAVQATLRAIWAGHDLGRRALDYAYSYVAMGTDRGLLRDGQSAFVSGERRIEPRVR